MCARRWEAFLALLGFVQGRVGRVEAVQIPEAVDTVELKRLPHAIKLGVGTLGCSCPG